MLGMAIFCMWIKQNIRKRICTQRKLLSAHFQHHAANKVCARLSNLNCLQKSQHIAFYLAYHGEMDPALAMQQCMRFKQCYLPIIQTLNQHALCFAKTTPQSKLIKNQYGILEPAPPRQIRPIAQLDIILLPLVAFDLKGNRLGMGGGFYDRTLAFGKRPILIGLAYEFQKLPHVPTHSNDIRLDAVITEKNNYVFNANALK